MNFNKLLGICHPRDEASVGADLSAANLYPDYFVLNH